MVHAPVMSLLLLLLLCDDAEPTYAHTHVTPSCRKLIRLRTGYCTVWQRCYVAVVVPSFVLFVLAAFITPLLTSPFFAVLPALRRRRRRRRRRQRQRRRQRSERVCVEGCCVCARADDCGGDWRRRCPSRRRDGTPSSQLTVDAIARGRLLAPRPVKTLHSSTTYFRFFSGH